MQNIDGIILAAGFSRRMGRDKLLLPVGDEIVVERVVKAALHSKLSSLILVYRKNSVAEIGKKYGIRTIKNNKARLGQSESVKCGVEKATGDGYLFIAGDQPFVSCSMINEMINDFRVSGKGIIIPTLDGQIHMPILFSSKYRKELLRVHGEKGGFEIISNNQNDIHWYQVNSPRDVTDIDTEREYRELIARKDSECDGIQD